MTTQQLSGAKTGSRQWMEEDLQNLICRTSPCQPCIICNALSLLGVIFSRKIKLLAAVGWLCKRQFQFLNCLIFPFHDDPPSVKKKPPKTTYNILHLIKLTQERVSLFVCLFHFIFLYSTHGEILLVGRINKQPTKQPKHWASRSRCYLFPQLAVEFWCCAQRTPLIFQCVTLCTICF